MPTIKEYPCRHCGTHYPLWEMVRIHSTKDGHVYICKPCQS